METTNPNAQPLASYVPYSCFPSCADQRNSSVPREFFRSLLGERILSPEPEFMQKYSDEVRDLIARKAYELYEQRGREAERHVEDWLKAEELVRKEMNETR